MQENYSIPATEWAAKIISDRESKVIAITAGLGSGKTHGAAQKHVTLSFINCKSPFSAFVEPTYKKIDDTAIPTFKKVFADIGFIEGLDFKIVKSPFPKIIICSTGHEIHMLSGDRPESIVGVEYSHATLDEAGDLKENVFLLVRSRLRCRFAVVRQLVVVGSPQGITWFANTFDSETQEGWTELDERDWVLPERKFRRLRLRTYDNPFLPDDYLDTLYDTFGHNKNLVKSYIDGIFCPLWVGNAYELYNPELHLIDNINPSPYLDIALTFDFNANPLCWTALQEVRYHEDMRRQRWTAIHEASEHSSQLDDAAVEFALKHPVDLFGETRIFIYGDSSGHAKSHKTAETDYEALARHLKQIGYKRVIVRAIKYNPLETMTVDAANRLFAHDRARICKRCKNLNRSLLATTWKEGVRKLDKPNGEDWTHPGDGFKYFAYVILDNEGNKVTSVNG